MLKVGLRFLYVLLNSWQKSSSNNFATHLFPSLSPPTGLSRSFCAFLISSGGLCSLPPHCKVNENSYITFHNRNFLYVWVELIYICLVWMFWYLTAWKTVTGRLADFKTWLLGNDHIFKVIPGQL